jgi:hypothetical protein
MGKEMNFLNNCSDEYIEMASGSGIGRIGYKW